MKPLAEQYYQDQHLISEVQMQLQKIQNPSSFKNKHHPYNEKKRKRKIKFQVPKMVDLQLQEMITIGLMRGSGLSGVIKKMLHVPTLQLYAVKE